MQDPKTGEMIMLSEPEMAGLNGAASRFEKLRKIVSDEGVVLKSSEDVSEAAVGAQLTGLQFSDGRPVPADVARFSVGEIVDVKGGTFRVRKITKKDIILRGIPSR